MINPAFHDDDEDQTVFPVALDDKTVARLMEICDEAKAPPAAVIASILHDVLEDDAFENDPDFPAIHRPNANRDLN